MKKTLIVGDVHEPLELIRKGPVINRCPETENTREDALQSPVTRKLWTRERGTAYSSIQLESESWSRQCR